MTVGAPIAVQGHRGCLYLEPENTLAGFRKCVELGVHSVELDVFRTADDKLVVFHGGQFGDGSVDEATGGKGLVSDMTYAQISQLTLRPKAFDCSPDRVSGDGAHIPLLDDVLTVLRDGGIDVTIELKGPNTEQLSVDAARRANMMTRVTFSSFHHDRIRKVKEFEPSATTAALFGPEIPENLGEYARSVGADEVDLRYNCVTDQHVADARAAGLRVMVWFRAPVTLREEGVVEEEHFERLAALGPDMICTNKPDTLLAFLRKRAVFS